MSQPPPPPPPPPPHGDNPRTTAGGSGLPPGKYDIFVIPQHSAGSGFLYLPSLKPAWNSFIAGVAFTLFFIIIGNSLAPALKAWWDNFQGLGGVGYGGLVVASCLGTYVLGTLRNEANTSSGSSPGGGHNGGRQSHGGGFGGSGAYYSPPPNTGPPPSQAPPPQPPPPPPPPQNEAPRGERPHQSWHEQPQPPPQPRPQPQEQREQPKPPPPQPPPQSQSQPQSQPRSEPQPPPPRPTTAKTETPKGSWQRAREEIRKREEERKAKEAEQKRKEESLRRLQELREKDAKERERRETEARAREAKEKDQEAREAKTRELKEKEEALKREEERLNAEKARQAAREREARESKERARKDEEETNARKGSTYAFSSLGEKTSMWPNGKPPAATSQPAATARPAPTPTASSTKTAPAPAKSTAGTEETYSYRPYDKPKKPGARKKSVSDFSESSWAPSASTARTSPPPSMRGPYTTDDPQKIVIKAVYGYLNQFSKTPASQLISGTGTVTDGLILRITSAGLFVDDDVRGVAQREWDVKAWTLKQVEVWCPTHLLSSSSSNLPGAIPTSHPFFKTMPGVTRRAAERGAPKTVTGEEAVAYLEDLGRVCQGICRPGLPSRASASMGSSNIDDKIGEWAAKGLHLLRATIRDQEGKRYLFVIGQEESWKISQGLQTLRGGTQVRALGVAGFSSTEAKNLLESLGWS
ncbi:hypothetical protein B0T24DRAFT_532634 [Lasiosphaeria ovina]|uniref:Proline-rich protein RiP-15 n=1 Tax=Lasiosphaeria ovina TaxID=92902 RepID=A0AAE0K4H5_9PEZI|nr:hypothetical protein B0T24DRAFT_532634 [Lasiosphaeria ovina]